MLICPPIRSTSAQLGHHPSQGRIQCIPAGVSHIGQLPLAFPSCPSWGACVSPLQHSSCVSYPTMSPLFQWGHNSVASNSSCLFSRLCALMYRHFRGAPKCADSPEGHESFPHKAVPQALPYLHNYASGDPTSAWFCWLLCPVCSHHLRSFACLPYPPLGITEERISKNLACPLPDMFWLV